MVSYRSGTCSVLTCCCHALHSLFLSLGVLPDPDAALRAVRAAGPGCSGAVRDEEGRSSAQCHNVRIL